MVNLVREARESKKKIVLSGMVAMLALIASLSLILVAEVIEMENWIRVLLAAIGIVVLVMGIVIACILEREAGAYECPSCKTRFVPEMGEYIMGPHTIMKRRLKCSNCGAYRYCKKVLTK